MYIINIQHQQKKGQQLLINTIEAVTAERDRTSNCDDFLFTVREKQSSVCVMCPTEHVCGCVRNAWVASQLVDVKIIELIHG